MVNPMHRRLDRADASEKRLTPAIRPLTLLLRWKTAEKSVAHSLPTQHTSSFIQLSIPTWKPRFHHRMQIRTKTVFQCRSQSKMVLWSTARSHSTADDVLAKKSPRQSQATILVEWLERGPAWANGRGPIQKHKHMFSMLAGTNGIRKNPWPCRNLAERFRQNKIDGEAKIGRKWPMSMLGRYTLGPFRGRTRNKKRNARARMPITYIKYRTWPPHFLPVHLSSS